MKKLLLISLFLLFACSLFTNNANALLVTANADKDKFGYEIPLTFATNDLTASRTKEHLDITGATTNRKIYYVVPRDARIVGISVYGNATCTAGAASFDVTINGNPTGVEALIRPVTLAAIGNDGSAGATTSYMRQDRDSDVTHQGFKLSSTARQWNGNGDGEHPWGMASTATAGSKIGVDVTTDSSFAPSASTDYDVVVYVVE